MGEAGGAQDGATGQAPVGQAQAFPVIALVCSAGGLAALVEVLSALPTDLPAALIVIQHQAPGGDDLLAHVLQPRTLLPIAPVHDGLLLRPGVVHVPPAGHHLLVTAQRSLLLVPVGPVPPPRPSADLLLSSLALAVGSAAIAVVLSGRGSDGATGATVVHRCGGVVIAASPQASAHPDMPLATAERDHITDHVAEPARIAALLVQVVTGTALRAQ
ncbi:chemotaxis protein CheB [Kineococcus sp. SYSU DK005]|uniref:chemotaxis protein CheB n=1 Tax=Kineococcus sp. SYSU DK005 TaxID=3383126 RepID=UPI003D7C432E